MTNLEKYGTLRDRLFGSQDSPTHADRVSERHLIRLRYLNLAGAPKPLQALLDGVEAELLAAGGDQDDIRMLRQQALIEREQ